MLNSTVSNKILKSIVGKDSAYGSTIYIGLSSTAPNADGSGITEPSGNGYARVLIGASNQSLTQKFGEPVDGVITNNVDIYFPESTGSWGDPLTHFFFASSATSTDSSAVLAFDKLQEDGVAAPVSVTAEKTVVMFRKGKLSITFQNTSSEA